MLTSKELQFIKDKQAEALSLSRANRRKQLDNEKGRTGVAWTNDTSGPWFWLLLIPTLLGSIAEAITGFLSTWYMERAYRYGWEQALEAETDGEQKATTTDPQPTVRKISVGLGSLIGGGSSAALFGLFLAGPLGFVGALLIGLAVGIAAGGILGYGNAWLENGKLQAETESAKIEVKKLAREARGNTRAEKQAEELEGLQKEMAEFKKSRAEEIKAQKENSPQGQALGAEIK